MTGGFVDRDRVIGSVGRKACDVALNRIDQVESGLRVIGGPIGQHLRDDRTRSIDAEVELLPPALVTVA